MRDLELLAQLQHVPRPEELARLEGGMFENAAEWLTASDRATSKERASVRHRFTQWLAHQGAMESQLGVMSGKLGAAQGQPIPLLLHAPRRSKTGDA